MDSVKYSDLQQLESETLNVIRQEGVFQRIADLYTAAHSAQIVKHSRQPLNFHLAFSLPTRIREEERTGTVQRSFHVGCLAKGSQHDDEISQLSYSVLIGLDAHPSKSVARKLHFDFEPASERNNAEEKPSFHMQVCGKLSPHHRSEGYKDEHIEHLLPSWSKPRIPTQPMSLALILNWLFMEFGAEASVHNIRQSHRWQRLVREAERKILLPYYRTCANFLSSHANADDSFFHVQLYGNV